MSQKSLAGKKSSVVVHRCAACEEQVIFIELAQGREEAKEK